MARPLRIKYLGVFYHVTSLSNERLKHRDQVLILDCFTKN